MDPITGIGLAASIVQLVQFGITTVQTCQQIYEQGSTNEHIDADYCASHLSDLTSSLRQSLEGTGKPTAALPKEERDLIDLGRKCEECASKLQHELRKLQTRSHASALEAARKAARSIWKRRDVVKIQKQLESYRKTLETSLLHRISQHFDAQSLSTSNERTNLDQSLKHFTKCLANSQTILDKIVRQESEQTRQHIDAQIARLEQIHIDERLYQDITKSLFFPEISLRREQVAYDFDGIEDSYEWIFDPPSAIERESPWADFSKWLKFGTEIYWINGKAGSGKSTLMNYICDHERTLELLRQWSSERRLLTPTYFFWNAGTAQQKTINGLLRSLIHQMLTECRDLIACFKNEPLHAWNEKRLLSVFSALLTQTQVPVAICCFVDGLDEFDGRYIAVIETLDRLAGQSHLKICLSSRPLPVFENAFAAMPNLKLQDLTFNSILTYAETQLSSLLEEKTSDDEQERALARCLLEKIVNLAEGVFLWAVTAIRDLRDGLEDFVDLRELERAIDDLPAGIENLYMHMLSRIKPAYRREAARFLQIVLYNDVSSLWNDLDLYRLYFIHGQKVFEDRPCDYGAVDMSALVKACYALRTQLLSHTLGLLDVVPIEDHTLFPGRYHDGILLAQVQFHHRTVKEFLLNNTTALWFVATAGLREDIVRLSIARGGITHLTYLMEDDGRIPNQYSLTFSALFTTLFQVKIVEELVGLAQSKFMRSLHDYQFMWNRFTLWIEGNYLPYIICRPEGSKYVSIDLIGLAASLGMFRYVCEVLELPAVENGDHLVRLLDVPHPRSANSTVTVGLSWVVCGEYELRPADYRRQLSKFLNWKSYNSEADITDLNVNHRMLTETYLLACCAPDSHGPKLAALLVLIDILLQAGADPMVRVEPANKLSNISRHIGVSFWEKWLHFLAVYSGIFHRLPEGLIDILGTLSEDQRAGLSDVFNTTKALLVRGASLTFELKCHTISRWGEQTNYFELEVEVTSLAIFWLNECFKWFPEFCEYVAAMKPPVERPWRTIVSIARKTSSTERYSKPEKRARVYPDKEESEMLWPLIEKWEETGQRGDLSKLRSAMRSVWRAHKPEIKLDYDSDESKGSEESGDTDEEQYHLPLRHLTRQKYLTDQGYENADELYCVFMDYD